MKKNSYEFTSIFQYAEDGINITFPDIPSAISYAQSTEEAIKNAEEVLGLILYDMESDKKEIPKATPFENIKTKEDEKAIIIRVWMPLVRNELDEQAVKKTLTIPQWLNKLAEAENVNFSKLLQSALKDYLKVKRRI
jgi:predicted RNase H-like HicB family nuclease